MKLGEWRSLHPELNPNFNNRYSFEPDPKGEAIGTVGNVAIAELSLREKWQAEKAMKGDPHCGSCEGRYQDKLDQLFWATDEGPWSKTPEEKEAFRNERPIAPKGCEKKISKRQQRRNRRLGLE